MNWKNFLAKKHDKDAIEKFNDEMFRERIREAILEIVNYDLIDLEVAKQNIYVNIESCDSSFIPGGDDSRKAIIFRMFTDSKKSDYWLALKHYEFNNGIKLKTWSDNLIYYSRNSEEFVLKKSYFNEIVHKKLYEVFGFR